MLGRVGSLLARLALAVAAVGTCLLAVEVAFRLAPIKPHGHHHRLFNEHDPLLSWRPIAGRLGLANREPEFTDKGVPRELLVFQRHLDPQTLDAWNLTEAILAELRREVASAGSDLLVMHVPHRATVYPQLWKKLLAGHGIAAGAWESERVQRELELRLERIGIAHLPTLERFRATARNLEGRGRSLYFENDGQNEDGHQLAGELLAQFLGPRVTTGQP